MDKLSNEIFYFGAGVAGLIAALHVASQRHLWRATALALFSVIVFADAFTWHLIEGLKSDAALASYGVRLIACDYLAPVVCLLMIGIAENDHVGRRNRCVLYLAGAAAYCLIILVYWRALVADASVTAPIRDFSEHAAHQFSANSAREVLEVANQIYGGFAAACEVLIIAALGWQALRSAGDSSEPTELWKLICLGESAGLLLYSRHTVIEPARSLTLVASIAGGGLVAAGSARSAVHVALLGAITAIDLVKRLARAVGKGGRRVRDGLAVVSKRGRATIGSAVRVVRLAVITAIDLVKRLVRRVGQGSRRVRDVFVAVFRRLRATFGGSPRRDDSNTLPPSSCQAKDGGPQAELPYEGPDGSGL